MSARHVLFEQPCVRLGIVPLLLAGVALAGCGTMGGGSQVQNTIYDTHRRVANLDKNLEPSVSKLNENVAGLLARVDESDQQVKALQSSVEENTVKLNGVEKKLDALTNTLYRYFKLSQSPLVPGTGAAPGAPGMQEEVRVLPPPGSAPQPSVAPTAPGSELPSPGAPVAPPPSPAPVAPPPPAGPGQEDADYQQALRSFQSENYAGALEQFSAFIQRYLNSQSCPNAQFWRARSLEKLERYEEAIADFSKLRTAYPTSVRVPYAMLYEGLCHKKLGQTDRASELLKEVLRNYPTTPAADQAKMELQKVKGN
jgi:tol-pal system protein YbgF